MTIAATTAVVAQERNWRPESLDEFIGQDNIRQRLAIMLNSIVVRNDVLEHLCFYGPPGLGKTTVAKIIANALGSRLHEIAAPSLSSIADLGDKLSDLSLRDVLFLDEIHALRTDVAESLYSAMEDFRATIVFKIDRETRIKTIPIPPFTLIGATTNFGKLPAPLRARFGQTFEFEYYTAAQLREIVRRSTHLSGNLITQDAMEMIAARSRGTPRNANRLLRRCVDLAIYRKNFIQEDETDCFIDRPVAHEAMYLEKLDPLGLNAEDRRVLYALHHKMAGRPGSLGRIANNAQVDIDKLERDIEPWLIRAGLMVQTDIGRSITRQGARHILSLVDQMIADNEIRT
ncbi:MAG: Holliday junction branch migration DNA helicase RuvB [Anaerolineae bacterium]|nr:Holliday junction branch migration DNA helicase RuvB [Anaerolineae bacterium]